MKNKWYISALIFALVIVGINLEQVATPNQEIVLQFADTDVTLHETQETIALVKSQLEVAGVAEIKIQDLENGTLKITYYSDIAVSEIKKIVIGETSLSIDYTSYDSDKEDTPLPSEKYSKGYQLDIYEIGKANDVTSSSGTIVVSKSEIIRFFNPDTYAAISKECGEEKNKTEKVAYTVYATIAIAIQEPSYNIPEVRAGPKA